MNWSALSRFISLHRCVTFFNDVMYNEQTRWCTFGYAFFSQSIQDHKLWSLSFFIFPCLKSKYENNNRTHRETNPWSLPFTTSQYTLDLWSNRAFLMNDVSNLNSYNLIQLRFWEEVWTHRRDCSVIAN